MPMTPTFRPLLLLLAAACAGGGGSGAAEVVVRDSAGIEIVEHSAELIAALPEWGLIGEPLVDIGGGSDPNALFARVYGVVRLTDGRIVVSDAQNRDLRLFDAQGRFLQLLARPGQGPGDISGAGTIRWLPGDTLAVSDNLRRTALFGPDGRFARQVTHPPRMLEEDYVDVLWPQRDGRFLVAIRPNMWVRPPQSMADPMVRHPYPLARLTSEGQLVDTVVMVLTPPYYPNTFVEQGRSFTGWTAPLFAEQTQVAVDHEQVVVGTNKFNELRVYRDGRLVRIIRNATPAAPVTEADRRRYLEAVRARVAAVLSLSEQDKEERLRETERQRMAERFPFHDRITLGMDGSIWVQDYQLHQHPLDADPYRLLVYGSDGKAIARVVLPDRVTPLQMEREFITGAWLDPDEVPYVRIWRIGPSTDAGAR